MELLCALLGRQVESYLGIHKPESPPSSSDREVCVILWQSINHHGVQAAYKVQHYSQWENFVPAQQNLYRQWVPSIESPQMYGGGC